MKVIPWVRAACLLVAASLQAGGKIEQTLEVSSNGQVNIENMRGKVNIVGWDKSQVSVSGELDDEALGYTFESEGGLTVFKVNMPKDLRNEGGQGSDLKIYLPFDSELIFDSKNGDVSVTAVSGGVAVRTVSGDIDAEKLSKRITLETVNGHVRARELDGQIKLSTVNGSVVDKGSKGTVHYDVVNGEINARTSARQVHVENVNGTTTLELGTVDYLDMSTVNGALDASLGLAEGAKVSVDTVGGNARLRFVGTVGGDFTLNSHGGKIVNGLTNDLPKKSKYGPGRILTFDKSGGDAEVEINTVSGHLTIEAK